MSATQVWAEVGRKAGDPTYRVTVTSRGIWEGELHWRLYVGSRRTRWGVRRLARQTRALLIKWPDGRIESTERFWDMI